MLARQFGNLVPRFRTWHRLKSTFPWYDYLPAPLHHQEVKAKRDSGKKPVVLCHGMLGMSTNWLGLAKVIAVSDE